MGRLNWKTWAIIALIVAGIFGWYTFASTQNRSASADPSVQTPALQRRAIATATGVGTLHMEWLDGQSGSYHSERNLFVYKEPPPPPPPPPPKPLPPMQGPPAPPPPPPPPAPPRPPAFPYQFIGTFGPASNPIATFTGSNGQIVNARAGDTMDNKFVLRGIGIESVEIGYVGFPPDVKTRIPLAQ